MNSYDILLDVGGTGIKGGYFSVAENKISHPKSFVSNSDQNKDIITKHFCHICSELWSSIGDNQKCIRNIRMAFPGPFDYEKGISRVKGLAKYDSLFGVSIPNEIIALAKEKAYDFIPKDIKCFRFVNDVEAYALGAMNKEKLTDGYRVLYLCIGTGAGSAYSVNGNIVGGEEQGVPQNSWIYSVPFMNSIIDEYISVRGINSLSEKYCGRVLSPLELSELAKSGDEKGISAYEEFGDYLKSALVPLLEKFNANALVIGGNISRSAEIFITPVREFCSKSGIKIIVASNTSELTMLGLTLL